MEASLRRGLLGRDSGPTPTAGAPERGHIRLPVSSARTACPVQHCSPAQDPFHPRCPRHPHCYTHPHQRPKTYEPRSTRKPDREAERSHRNPVFRFEAQGSFSSPQ